MNIRFKRKKTKDCSHKNIWVIHKLAAKACQNLPKLEKIATGNCGVRKIKPAKWGAQI